MKMFDRLTQTTLRATPLSFDYPPGRMPDLDAIVTRLVADGYNVFIHYWPEAEFDSVPEIQRATVKGWNHQGIGFRASTPETYFLLNGFERRVAVNLWDTEVSDPQLYACAHKVLCRHLSLVRALRAVNVPAELLSYDSVLKTLVEMTPPIAEWAVELPPFSVVVAAQGPARYLEQCLSRVFSQIYPGLVEAVVVDSAPSEEAAECRLVTERYGARYIRSDGSLRDINTALQSAVGDCITLLHAETFLAPWYLLTMQRILQEHGLYAAASSPIRDLICASSDTARLDALAGSSIPAPYSLPAATLRSSRTLAACPGGNVTFYREAIPNGLEEDEAMDFGLGEVALRCRLAREGFELLETGDTLAGRIACERAPFIPGKVRAHEARLIERYPHQYPGARLGPLLEPCDSGMISIVVPVHVRSPLRLQRFLKILAHQEYAGRIETIVCDDGSPYPDRIAEVCRLANARYIRVERPEGYEDISCRARARNAGVAAASGDYLMFLDQDVILTTYHLQACANILRFEGGDVSCHSVRFDLFDLLHMGEMDSFSRFHLTTERVIELLSRMEITERLPLDGFEPNPINIIGNNLFVSRQAAEAVGPYDEGYLGYGEEDLDYTYRLFTAGVRMARLRGMRCYHIGHPREESRDKRKQLYKNIVRFYGKFPDVSRFRPGTLEMAQAGLAYLEAEACA